MMTVEQMAEKILALVSEGGGTSYAQIMNLIGEEAKGDYSWELVPNLVEWSGMSQTLLDALNSLKDKIEKRPASLITYLVDGRALPYPLTKRFRRDGYKKPHWQPVVFYLRTMPRAVALRKIELLRMKRAGKAGCVSNINV